MLTPLQITQIVEQVQKALANPANYPWPVLLSILLVLAGAAYLGAYYSEKGKGLATKEDIAELTRKVEEVKAAYSKDVERYKGDIQLRNLSLTRRLEAHQQGYARLMGLVDRINLKGNEFMDLYLEEKRWWTENNFYLTADATLKFQAALEAVLYMNEVANFPKEGDLRGTLPEDRQTLRDAYAALKTGVQLPDLDEDLAKL